MFALQTLKLFDSFFWPSSTAPIRNCHMLKFQYQSPSMMAVHTSDTSTLNKQHQQSTVDSSQRSLVAMSMYSQILHLSLFVLQTLSPFHNLATLNVFRLRALLRPVASTTILPQPLVPVPELVLLILCHAMTSLQRVGNALAVVYTRVGMNSNTFYSNNDSNL